jgi:hypothetical protein
VVVDRLTKYVHFIVISSQYNTSQVAYLFIMVVLIIHCLPRKIVSDWDSRFLNTFWKELFRLSRTYLTPSASYHLHIDGNTEIVKKWIEGYLRNYVSEK